MSGLVISGARILARGQWLDDHALVIEGQSIAAILPRDEVATSAPVHHLNGGMIVPGFVDTQVNGGGGILFNDSPTVEGIARIAEAHRRFGTTALLPTLISDDLDVVACGIEAVDAAILAGVPGIVGIHIEGPFLNRDKRGIHDGSKIRPLDAEAVELICSLKHGVTLVTLAPECVERGLIARLVSHGVIVAAGHSDATYDDVASAAEEGLSGATHLFNAMSQFGSREPGLVGAALDLKLTCGLIADGHHVHPASLRVAFRAHGANRLMLVTDAMPSVGQADKAFTLGGVQVGFESGALRGPDGTLAGSDLDMAQAVRNAVDLMDIDLVDASQMASGTPARFLGIEGSCGELAPGMRADIVYLDGESRPVSTWIAGERM